MSLTFYKYRLPFTKPLKTSKNTFTHREGIILRYANGADVFYSEIAPLPGFSKESLDDVIESLIKHKEKLISVFNASRPATLLAELCCEYQLAASLQFGLDALAYQIEAKKDNMDLKNYLFSNIHDSIPLNFLISNDCKDYISEIRNYIFKGYSTLKFKVGTNFSREFKILKKIRSQFPDLKIRLDANQSWKPDEAVDNCNKFSQFDIQYCEEPLRNVTTENVSSLVEQINIPLAIDETLYQVEDWQRLLPYTSVIILKPMVLGSFKTLFDTKRLVEAHDNSVVFTTSLESGIGRRITAILASGLADKNLAQGLSTGNLFNRDVLSDAACISDGFYHLGTNLHNTGIDSAQLHSIL